MADGALLSVQNLSVHYGEVRVLWDVHLQVRTGEIVALVGANAAGKSTTLNAISGVLPRTAGTIHFAGEPIQHLPPSRRVQMGIVQVPEARRLFPYMTVQENLELGAYTPGARKRSAETLAHVFDLLPRLKERRHQLAGSLSGGEQQMCAIGRGLMARPRLLMLDEPTLGLAPLIVEMVFATIRRINAQGTTVMLVEQKVGDALALAHRAYVLENGRIALEGSGAALLEDQRLKVAYLGM